MRVKNRCNRQEARDKAIQTKTLPVLDPDTVQDDPEVMLPIERQCLNEGNVYQDMDTWPAKPGSCTICSCKVTIINTVNRVILFTLFFILKMTTNILQLPKNTSLVKAFKNLNNN